MSEPYNSQNLVAPAAPGIVGATLPYAAALVIDMNGPAIQEVILDSVVAFTASNISAQRKVDVIVRNPTGGLLNTTFDSDWIFISSKPTSIAGSKSGVLTLFTNGVTAAKIIARWAVQA